LGNRKIGAVSGLGHHQVATHLAGNQPLPSAAECSGRFFAGDVCQFPHAPMLVQKATDKPDVNILEPEKLWISGCALKRR
jgi:hypothetical protein